MQERSPAVVLAVVAVAVVGLALLVELGAEGRGPAGFGGLNLPGGATKCVEDPELVAERVEEVRGLEFEKVVEVECVEVSEIRDRVKELSEGAEREKPSPAEREQIRAEAAASLATLKLAGLLPPGFDENADPVESAGLEAAGVYVPESGTVVISPSPRSESYLAHELVHALDDQNFGIDIQQTRSSEADAGYQALIEGSATFHELAYAQKYLDSGVTPRDAIRARSLLEAPSGSPALAQYLLFPYLAGGQFVASLVDEGGSEVVNDAYKDPPTSTEQVLEPQKWFEREEFERVETTGAARILEGNWEQIGRGEAGAVDAILTLEQGGNPDLARIAAEGVAGGRYEAWELPDAGCKQPCRGARVAIINYDFDTTKDAKEFAAAGVLLLGEGLDGKPGQSSALIGVSGSQRTTSPYGLDAGAAAVSSTNQRSAALVFAPTQELARSLASAASAAAGNDNPIDVAKGRPGSLPNRTGK